MRLETFFEKFELFADAPNAVAKMRALALRLAFSGRFSGTLPAEAGLTVGWEARTIESICSSITPGFACSRNHQAEDGHVHLRTHNISTLGTLNFDLLVRIDPKMVDAQKASVRKGDILFNNTNSQELVGKTCLVDRDYDYAFSNHITRLRLKQDVFPGFVAFYLTFLRNSGYFAELCTRWINQAAVNTETLKRETIPLPPLVEQKRIVAKVDELMALCDRLEAQQKERDTRHAALSCAALARFGEAPTPANLDFLFHTSYAIASAELRKVILSLAVQGKLVPQDPNDEPASVTFKKLSAAAIENGPDDFPEHWLRVPLGQLGEWRGGGTPSKSRPEFWTGDIPWVSPKDMKSLKISDAQDHISHSAVEDSSVRAIPAGSILMVVRGMILARAFPVAITTREVTINQDMKALLPFESDTREFILLALRAIEPDVLAAIERSTHGTCKLETGILHALTIPIPPLAEQRRIVAKVDELTALADSLEIQLAESKAKSAALLDAAIHELLNPTAEVIDLASYRAAVGCYAIGKMQGKRYFGRTAAMKTFYLAQAHVGLELGFQPWRDAAGPLDAWIYRFEDEGQEKGWFKVVEPTPGGNKKIEYRAGDRLAEQTALAERQLSAGQRQELDRLLALFADKTTEEVEIIATLFAAWNDFLIDGHSTGDDEIVTEVRENWHRSKTRFAPTLLRQWLGWLRQINLVPQGRLPHTMHQQQLSLN